MDIPLFTYVHLARWHCPQMSHPVFKAKTRCSSYVCSGSNYHIYGQNVSTRYQCLYYIVSYYTNLLQVQKGINSEMDINLSQAVERGFRNQKSQLIVGKVHVAHDPKHGYHDSLHSAEVAQLYPQVSDSITRRWLSVSILLIIHFLRCTVRRSPHSFFTAFPSPQNIHTKVSPLRKSHPTEAPSCAKVSITPSIT
jgi:hypothetical protein